MGEVLLGELNASSKSFLAARLTTLQHRGLFSSPHFDRDEYSAGSKVKLRLHPRQAPHTNLYVWSTFRLKIVDEAIKPPNLRQAASKKEFSSHIIYPCGGIKSAENKQQMLINKQYIYVCVSENTSRELYYMTESAVQQQYRGVDPKGKGELKEAIVEQRRIEVEEHDGLRDEGVSSSLGPPASLRPVGSGGHVRGPWSLLLIERVGGQQSLIRCPFIALFIGSITRQVGATG